MSLKLYIGGFIMKPKATKTTKAEKATKSEKQPMKKSKFVLAWEQFEPNRYEIVDMRAILK